MLILNCLYFHIGADYISYIIKLHKLLHFELRDSHPPARALLLLPFIFGRRLKG
nr:MAG TPA: hypothetical protein [Caudoviricetes sp.]